MKFSRAQFSFSRFDFEFLAQFFMLEEGFRFSDLILVFSF